jgi:hypothetical protein
MKIFACMFLVIVLATGCVPTATTAPTAVPATVEPSPTEVAATEQQSAEWSISMAQIPRPKTGCFTATYPKTEWQDVPCTTAPPYPQPPRRQPRAETVGNGNDVSPQVPTGLISTAIGSFDTVTGVTSESGQINNTGPSVANAYSLQLNSNYFASTACSGAAVPATCQGWEQFLFVNDGSTGFGFIQYWLLQYNTTCPAAWIQFSFPGSATIYCYKNSTNSVAVPNQPITNLHQLSLSGTAGAGGDSVTLTSGSTVYSATGDNAVNAAAGWTVAEFTVVGDAGGGQANFNSGSTVVPRARVIYGSNGPPNCVAQGFTGETNNLSFGPTAPSAAPPGPALSFTESSAGGALSNCAAATTVGDTHLATFGGLFYDFQASGDFVLALVDPDFVVQARQVSGAPTWPDASINNAIATQMGKTRVAVCLGPARLDIDGRTTELGDGKTLSLADGVDVLRRGNVYVITRETGDSVRAEVNASYINVSVGLGHWPAKVRGLLTNANGNVNQLETRDGAVLTNPFAFEEFYHHYADSWRVAPSESLLSVCGEAKEHGIPQKSFTANDLDPRLSERTRAVCMTAGVKQGPLLDACTLDVAVIGDGTAAKVLVDAPAPIAVGKLN